MAALQPRVGAAIVAALSFILAANLALFVPFAGIFVALAGAGASRAQCRFRTDCAFSGDDGFKKKKKKKIQMSAI